MWGPRNHVSRACAQVPRAMPTHLTDIIVKCGMTVGVQSDAEEFLQLLLQKTSEGNYSTIRRVSMTCTVCHTNTVQIEEKLVLLVPMRDGETNDLQAELGRLIDGITHHECPSRKCRRRETIHQVVIINDN